MTDPKRWLEDPDGPKGPAQELIRLGTTAHSPPEMADQIWQRLVPLLPPPGGGPGGLGSSAGAGAVKGAVSAGGAGFGFGSLSGLLGPLALGATLGLGAMAGSRWLVAPEVGGGTGRALSARATDSTPKTLAASAQPVRSPSRPEFLQASPSPSRPSENNAAKEVGTPVEPGVPTGEPINRHPSAAVPEPEGAPLLVAPQLPAAQPSSAALPDLPGADLPGAPTAAVSSVSRPTANTLREEALGLARARNRLATGSASAALAELDALHRRVPQGALVPEQEALTIEALVRSGQGAAAKSRGEAFLRNHPRSPLVSQVRQLINTVR